MSGVTARTLRYYDEIGLLPPARVGGNGYRYYGHSQLLQLQEILLLRELGMDLARIAQVVTGERDKVEALQHHHLRLIAERDRFDTLACTVAATIATLQHGNAMAADEMFQGFRFTPDTLDTLEALQAQRTGESSPYFEQIRHNIRDWDAAAYHRGATVQRSNVACWRCCTRACRAMTRLFSPCSTTTWPCINGW